MDDAKLGAAIRAVRIRSKTTQAEVAKAAGVRRYDVSRAEQGKLNHLPVGALRAIAAAVGMWIDLAPNWRGANLDRLINGAHVALQEAVLRYLNGVDGWIALPEVSFSIDGERGVIDVLAWHAGTRTLLIIELKTLLVDPADLAKTMGRRRRLARAIAATQGWAPTQVATWVIFTDTRTNRRRVAGHRDLLQVLVGLDGHAVKSWLRSPSGPMSALSFWDEPAGIVRQHVSSRRPRGARPNPVAKAARATPDAGPAAARSGAGRSP
jgi:transcriptional regulator with XRE-family HTH domain